MCWPRTLVCKYNDTGKVTLLGCSKLQAGFDGWFYGVGIAPSTEFLYARGAKIKLKMFQNPAAPTLGNYHDG